MITVEVRILGREQHADHDRAVEGASSVRRRSLHEPHGGPARAPEFRAGGHRVQARLEASAESASPAYARRRDGEQRAEHGADDHHPDERERGVTEHE